MLDDPSSRAYRLMHRAGGLLHAELARHPAVAERWFAVLSLLRHAPPGAYKQRITNSVAAIDWPALSIKPQRVRLGTSTHVWLRPHPGEFDFSALLERCLSYEMAIFEWLERTLRGYDTVVEIGANVGVFTVFMSEVKRAKALPKLRIVSFEPSREAFTRLLDNLAFNSSDSEVYNCAVSDRGGVIEFFEPRGHLTNGSIYPSFASVFSSDVRRNRVLTIGGAELEEIVPNPGKTLLKIDVEGAEALVLRGLRPWVTAVRPDVILEVLPGFESALRDDDYFAALGYRFFRFEDSGPVEVEPYEPSPSHRDHLLLAPAVAGA